MLEDADGRALLRERRRVTDEAVARCWELPPHTFGGAYAAFMGQRGFRADDRPPVRYVDDAQLAYVATRAREVRSVIIPWLVSSRDTLPTLTLTLPNPNVSVTPCVRVMCWFAGGDQVNVRLTERAVAPPTCGGVCARFSRCTTFGTCCLASTPPCWARRH